jgi:hypothetical protein
MQNFRLVAQSLFGTVPRDRGCGTAPCRHRTAFLESAVRFRCENRKQAIRQVSAFECALGRIK